MKREREREKIRRAEKIGKRRMVFRNRFRIEYKSVE